MPQPDDRLPFALLASSFLAGHLHARASFGQQLRELMQIPLPKEPHLFLRRVPPSLGKYTCASQLHETALALLTRRRSRAFSERHQLRPTLRTKPFDIPHNAQPHWLDLMPQFSGAERARIEARLLPAAPPAAKLRLFAQTFLDSDAADALAGVFGDMCAADDRHMRLDARDLQSLMFLNPDGFFEMLLDYVGLDDAAAGAVVRRLHNDTLVGRHAHDILY